MKTRNMTTITKCAATLVFAAWLAGPGHAGELHRAAEFGNAETVRRLIAQGTQVDEPGSGGLTALYITTIRGAGNQATVEVLLEHGAEPNRLMPSGESPLHRAAAGGAKTEAVAAMLAFGADPNLPDAAGNNALDRALAEGSLASITMLLEAGATLDSPRWLTADTHMNWLHHAAFHKETRAVRAFIAAGADLDVRNERGWTAVRFATDAGHLDGVRALLDAGADPDVRDNEGETALHVAAGKGALETARALLDRGADVNTPGNGGATALHRAAQTGKTATVEALMDAGAEPERGDDAGVRALHAACTAYTDGAALALLARGADATAKSDDGSSPLHYAWRHASVARALLAAGAEAGAVNGRGRTPLHIAANRGGLKTMVVLLEAGADPNATDDDGNSVLHWATGSASTRTLQALLRAGADTSARDALGRTPSEAAATRGNHEVHRVLEGWALMSDAAAGRVDIRSNDGLGNTALHWAADFDTVETAEMLLAEGADPNAQNTSGLSPLHIAADSSRMLKVLLDGGASVNLAGRGAATTLHYAAAGGAMESIEMLLQAGANPFARDARGATPARWAAAQKHREAAARLRAVTNE